jgi:ubiquinone/menaquinone biosynthesis C-methylase UbiE
MNVYERRVLPHLLHFAMRQQALQPFRTRIIGAAKGRVVELGIGSGLNLPLYGSAVSSITGIEPAPELLRMAATRAAVASAPVELIRASAEALPLESGSVDTVVTTWTLCTIPDVRQALREARRVLKPDGILLFVEHGRAPEPGVARWQDRLDPVWHRLAGGCHLNRSIDALIFAAGFRFEHLSHERVPGPATHTYLSEGIAHPQ